MFAFRGVRYGHRGDQRLKEIDEIPRVGRRFKRHEIRRQQVLVGPVLKRRQREPARTQYHGLLRINGSDRNGALVHIQPKKAHCGLHCGHTHLLTRGQMEPGRVEQGASLGQVITHQYELDATAPSQLRRSGRATNQ